MLIFFPLNEWVDSFDWKFRMSGILIEQLRHKFKTFDGVF